MLAWIGANVAPPDTDLGRALADAHEVRKPVEDDMSIGLAWPVRTLDDGQETDDFLRREAEVVSEAYGLADRIGPDRLVGTERR